MIGINKFVQIVKDHPIYRLTVQTMTYGIGTIVQRFLTLLLLPIYTRYLTPDDYGITGLLAITSTILVTVTMCALPNGISRYFFYPEKERTTIDEVVWSPILFILLFSSIILIPLAFASSLISTALFGTAQYAYLVTLTLVVVFVSNLSSIGRAILIFQEKALIVNLISIAEILVGIASGLLMVVYLRRGVTGMVEASLITAGIMLLPVLTISIFKFKPSFSLHILKKELSFSLPLVGALAAFFIIDSSDRYFLKMYLPLSEVGLYNIGYSIGLIMMVLVGGFTSAWPPYYHKNNQNNEGQTICNDVLRIYLLVGAICVTGLSVTAPFILKIFTTSNFHQAYTVVPFVASAYLLKGPYLIFLMGVLMKNKTSWQLYLESGAAAVNLLGNLLLIPLFGREAAAFTTFLSYVILAAGAYWMVMRINPIPVLSKRYIFQMMGLILFVTVVATFSPQLNLNIFLSSLVIVATFFVVLLPVSYKEFRPLMTRFQSA